MLIELIDSYLRELNKFHTELKHIAQYNVRIKTNEIEVRGHKLSIENSFELTQQIILEAINELLKTLKRLFLKSCSRKILRNEVRKWQIMRILLKSYMKRLVH